MPGTLNIDLPSSSSRRPHRAASVRRLEWCGCALGLAGALLLALHNASSGYGFVFFLVSNLFLIGAAVVRRSTPMLLMQLGFTGTSLVGVWNWQLVG